MSHVRSMMLGLTVALAGGGLAGRALAQDMPTVMPNNYVLSDILNSQRVERAIGARPQARPQTGAQGRAQQRAKPATVTAGATGVTGYRASPQVSAQVRDKFSQGLRQSYGPVMGPKVDAALRGSDPVRRWATLVASSGLKTGDVADALAGYWVLNWTIANGARGDRTGALAVRDQVRRALAVDPAHARLSQAGRQETAESLMMNYVLQDAAYKGAVLRGDVADQRRLGDQAVARFRREMGVDLRALRLTDQGFVGL